jgi:hypothetical protein
VSTNNDTKFEVREPAKVTSFLAFAAEALRLNGDVMKVEPKHGTRIEGPAWAVLTALWIKSWTVVSLAAIAAYGAAYTSNGAIGAAVNSTLAVLKGLL